VRSPARIFLLVVAAMVVIEMVIDPVSVHPDGVAYLDMGDAILGLKPWAIAAYFSPLYAAWIALAVRLVHPGPAAEFMVVRAASGVVVLLAALAFEMLLTEVIAFVRDAAPQAAMREGWWRTFGYGLFLWSAIRNVGLVETTPDVAVMAAIFAATALILRMTKPGGTATPRSAAALGLVLGLGYLAKAVMFVNSLVFLGLFAWLARRRPRAIAAACGVFAVVAGPWITALSVSKGRPTFGEVGRLSLVWYLTPVRSPRHWQGGPDGYGTPLHPTRELMTSPEVFEFATPFPVSYPPWYDASYWYEGVQPHVTAGALIRASVQSLKGVTPHLWMGLAALAVLVAWGRTLGPLAAFAGGGAVLAVPAILAYLLYSPIALYPRYLGGWAVLLYLFLVLAWGSWNGGRLLRMTETIMPAVLLVFAWQVGGVLVRQARASVDWPARTVRHEDDGDVRAARALLAAGVKAGDPVAAIGTPAAYMYWERLAHVRLIMEAPGREVGPDHGMFWRSDAAVQAHVLDLFRQHHVTAVVADSLPQGTLRDGWRRIPGSRYAYLMMQGEAPHD
jgi:hypothetical protein